LSLASIAFGQAPAPSASKAAAAVKDYTPARTADGQPDMQGMYTRNGVVGLEAKPPVNPIDPSGKNPLSVSDRNDGLGPYPKIFGEGGRKMRAGRGKVELRTGIVDPPDKNLPWRPEEDQKRREFLLKMNPPIDLQHVELNARCVLPGLFQGEDNNNPYQILQPPKEVVLLYDYNHTARVIHLDGRPHLGKDVRLFMGDSLGKWEGNTLTVDTTNFIGKMAYAREIPYLSDALHTIEKFTVLDDSIINYENTVDDEKLFTKPWRVAGYFAKVAPGTQSLEFACAEGSETLVNIFGKPPSPGR
jgi:hypothetical protein